MRDLIEDAQHDHVEEQPVMERRSFLKTMGEAVGMATAASLLGPDALLRKVEAATRSVSGLSPQQVAQDESFWAEVQQAFSISRSIMNLDNGWVCPSPRIVTEALVRYIWEQEEAPAYSLVRVLKPRVEMARTGLARQFGCDPEEIAVVRNATEALQTVLLGIDIKPGDEVLTTTVDYGSMLRGLEYRSRREGIAVKQLDVPVPPRSMDELVEAFERGITPKTRLILVSHVVYLNGQIFPIKPICDVAHRRGVEVVVDGAHSFAHLDFTQKDLDCDYFGTSLHKWLGAPKGTGMLYVRKDKIGKVRALLPSSDRMRENIRKYETFGTQSVAPFLAISEALAFLNGIGPKRKEERMRYLKNYWAERLQKLPNVRLHTSLAPEMSCGLANVELKGVPPVPLRDYLFEKHKILTASIDHEGLEGLRITPNLYTTVEELDYFCDVIEHVAKNGLPEPYKSLKPDDRRGVLSVRS